jgi:hypothetical protein
MLLNQIEDMLRIIWRPEIKYCSYNIIYKMASKCISLNAPSDACKLVDLEVGKWYYVKSVKPTQFGHICTTIDTSIKFLDDAGNVLKLTRSQISNTSDNVKFFSNKALSDWISSTYVEVFIIRVKDIGSFTAKDGVEHKVPMIDVHPVRVATPVWEGNDEDYSLLESQVEVADSQDTTATATTEDDSSSTCSSDDVE